MTPKEYYLVENTDRGAYIAHLEDTIQHISEQYEQLDLSYSYLQQEYEFVCAEADMESASAEKLLHRLESTSADLKRAEAQIYMYGEHTAALESLLKKEEDKNKRLNEEVDDLLVNIRNTNESIDVDSFIFGLLAGVCLFGVIALFMV